MIAIVTLKAIPLSEVTQPHSTLYSVLENVSPTDTLLTSKCYPQDSFTADTFFGPHFGSRNACLWYLSSAGPRNLAALCGLPRRPLGPCNATLGSAVNRSVPVARTPLMYERMCIYEVQSSLLRTYFAASRQCELCGSNKRRGSQSPSHQLGDHGSTVISSRGA